MNFIIKKEDIFKHTNHINNIIRLYIKLIDTIIVMDVHELFYQNMENMYKINIKKTIDLTEEDQNSDYIMNGIIYKSYPKNVLISFGGLLMSIETEKEMNFEIQTKVSCLFNHIS